MDYNTENGDQPETEPAYEETQVVAAAEGEESGADGDSYGQKLASKTGDDERKIFVGGLSWETTVKDMRDYFGKYGEVVDCTLKTDPTTGRSRGFGFVLFATTEDVDKVIDHGTHSLHGRNIDPKRANPRRGQEPMKKVFVGGLDPDTPEDTIRKHFGQFGKIEEIDLPYDKMKGQRRAFCFITFESEDVVDKCCKDIKQNLGGKEVDVKKATPKEGGFGFGGRGGRGGSFGGQQRGGRGGRGGYQQGGYGQNQAYDYNSYYNQGYGQGYDYNQGYGQGYGQGYDYNNYYNQGWGNYNQGYGTGYGNSGYGNNSYGGYDYSGWYGNNQAGQPTTTYGKDKRGGGGSTGGTYHPYSR